MNVKSIYLALISYCSHQTCSRSVLAICIQPPDKTCTERNQNILGTFLQGIQTNGSDEIEINVGNWIRKRNKDDGFSERAVCSHSCSNTPIKSNLLLKHSNKFYCLNFHDTVFINKLSSGKSSEWLHVRVFMRCSTRGGGGRRKRGKCEEAANERQRR